MRAVIIGTDFMRDTDGSFKALETNTNIQLDTQWSHNTDLSQFENFVTSNNFTEIVLISNENNVSPQSSYTINVDLEEIREENRINLENNPEYVPIEVFSNLKSYLTNFTTVNNITFTTLKTDLTSITVPFVEDADDKLIIRLSYDTTALIDDTYARDNWEFLKLMYEADSNSVPKCFINDDALGMDSIGTILRDNGNHPNYCIKKRVTPSDNKTYPKLFKIDTIEQLNTLKSELEVDEYIQEFIYNTDDLLDGRIKSYRTVDLIYGSNLDIINLQVLEKTTNLEIIENSDFDDNNQVQYWDRMRYTQKFYSQVSEIAIKLDATENTKIILPDGNISLAKNLNIGDNVKSILLNTLPTENLFNSETLWSGSFNETISDFEMTTTELVSNNSMDYFGALVTFETDNNSVFSDVVHALIMVKDGDNATFKQYGDLVVGNIVVLYDTVSNELVTSTITNISFKFDKFIGYSLNFEQSDLFLTLEETETQSRYGILTHNYDYDCRYANCYNQGYPNQSFRYYDCGSGAYYDYYGSRYSAYLEPGTVCVRVAAFTPVCEFWDEAGSSSYVWFDAYCNNQKSDITYKENLKLIGKSNNDINIYQFNYKGEDGLYEGVIAQELIGTEFETALSKNEDGFYVVDYNKIDVEFKKIK